MTSIEANDLRSGFLGPVNINPASVRDELSLIEHDYIDSYDEFVCGSWKTCLLVNSTGNPHDGQVIDYGTPSRPTPTAVKVPYLMSVIEDNFNVSALRYARVTKLTPSTVVVPHRDYVELAEPLIRIHVPLSTHPQAYASELETIYHMGVGEAWFLNASKPHSIANFSDHDRLHLLLDFAATGPESVFRSDDSQRSPLIPQRSIAKRRPFGPGDETVLRLLGDLIDEHNFTEIVSIVIKRYFQTDMRIIEVFDWLDEITSLSGDEILTAKATWLRDHALVARAETDAT